MSEASLQPQAVRIFLSSPSDVYAEREATVALLGEIEAELEGRVRFDVVRWEDQHYTAALGFQDQIVSPADCQLVICIFWSRLGVELPSAVELPEGAGRRSFARADGSLRTGSEYEFEVALEAARRHAEDGSAPLPDIFVYRRMGALPPVSGEEIERQSAQFRALDGFFRRWFLSESGHFLAAHHTYDRLEEFRANLRRDVMSWLERRQRGRWDIAANGSPFCGLKAYDASHEAVFFGRERAIRQARARLASAIQNEGLRSLLVIGSSGSGKSSLVRAGLLPRLLRPGGLGEADYVRALAFKPASLGLDPFAGLARLLLTGLGGGVPAGGHLPELQATVYRDPQRLERLLRGDPVTVADQILQAQERWAESLAARRKAAAHSDGGAALPDVALILFVDQLEEIFDPQLDKGDQEHLLALLRALAATPGCYVLATLRGDFYPQIQTSPALLDMKDRGAIFDLVAPSEKEIAEIIEGPAHLAGLSYERDLRAARDLRDELVREAAAPGALPLLSFTLQQLFDERERESGEMGLAEYDRLGGIRGAIGRRAESAYAELGRRLGLKSGELDVVLRRILRRLIREGEGGQVSARPAALDAFPRGSREREIVDVFVAERLLMLEADSESRPHRRDEAPAPA